MPKVSYSTRRNSGFSLVEVIIATSIFALMISGLMGLYFYSVASMYASGDRTRAVMLAQEGIEAVKNIRDTGFRNLVDGTYYVGPGNNNKWVLSPLPDTIGIYTRTIVVSSIDSSNKLVTSTVSWPKNNAAGNFTVSLSTYVSLWTARSWLDTTTAQFTLGTRTNTVLSTTADGEVKLDTIAYADWCHPENSQTAFDLPGSATARTIRAIPGRAHIGTNGTSPSYYNYSITDATPPALTNNGSFNGYTVNAVFGDDNYAYLATTDNSKEVVILNTSTTPYTEIGSFNASGNIDAVDVYVDGNVGYVVQGDQLRAFNLTSKTGVRPVMGSFTLPDDALHVYVRNGYAYVLQTSLAVRELEIVNVSNPAAMVESGYADVNIFTTPNDLYINNAGTRAFIGMNSSSFQREMYLVDISSKNGSRKTISSYETNGMSIKDLITIPDNTKLILTGSGGEEYQVVDIANEASLTRCGGMQINSGVYGVAAVVFQSGNAYSYVVTSDTSSELKVIRGGLGGGFGGGMGYPATGEFQSQVFDTGKQSYFYTFLWTRQLPANTTLRFQVRAGDSANLSAIPWFGPDGTNATYFTNESGTLIPESLQNKRYIQYKAYYTSDSVSTPILESVRLKYD